MLFSARKEFLAVHCFLSPSFFLFIYCAELILMMWRGRSSPEDTKAGELVHASPFHLFPCPFVSAFAILPPNKIKQSLGGKEKREKEKLNIILKTVVWHTELVNHTVNSPVGISLLASQVFIAENHWSGLRSLVSVTVSMLGLQWNLVVLCCRNPENLGL